MDTATFEESLGDEFELYKNDGKGITYYRSKKAMKIEYWPVFYLFAKHELYVMKGAKMPINSEFHQIFKF